MRKWFDALLHGATLLLLVASPVSAADRLTTGVGIGIWRFSAPSAELDAALGGSRVTVTGSIFGEYVDGPYFSDSGSDTSKSCSPTASGTCAGRVRK